MRFLLILLALLSTLLTTFGCASLPVHKDDAFTLAVDAVQKGAYVRGANAAWQFLESADQDDPRYDRGLRLLAQSAEGLQLNWAATVTYRRIAQARRNMELVPDALSGLQRIIETGVYDEDTLITAFIAGEEFGHLEPDLQAFVDFHKGMDLARRGLDDWANLYFGRLPAGSRYAQRARYVDAVRHVAAGEFGAARKIIAGLKEAEGLDPGLAGELERTLARMAFEEGDFEEALVHYETLRERAQDDPEILLEMAWTQYYLGDSRRALGLLVALDAPVHRSYVSPERYLLEALALRRLCQFQAARVAAVKLEARYKPTLEALRAGTLPSQIPELRETAGLRGRSRQNALLRGQLEAEKANAAGLALNESLHGYLDDLYSRGLEEARRREEEGIDRDVAELSEELLAAEEGVRLIVHELGVALLRGRRKPDGVPEKPAVDVPLSGYQVFYPFEGEYWTDELDDFVVIAEDRCID